MSIEKVMVDDTLAAEILRGHADVNSTKFFSDAESALQLGLMKHATGFVEPAHYHNYLERARTSTQQFFIVLEGQVAVDFFNHSGELVSTSILDPLDSILLIEGAHRIRTIVESRCVTVKQGPFVSLEQDRVEIQVAES